LRLLAHSRLPKSGFPTCLKLPIDTPRAVCVQVGGNSFHSHRP
jgi:hypothetical protein